MICHSEKDIFCQCGWVSCQASIVDASLATGGPRGREGWRAMRVASIGGETSSQGTKSMMEQHQGLVINSLKRIHRFDWIRFAQTCEAWRPDVGFVVAPLPAVEVYPSHPRLRFVASVWL